MEKITLTWLGHSCFKLECDGYRIILDPFQAGSVPGFPDVHEEAEQVLCSHEHGDHAGRGCVKVVASEKPCPFQITELQSYHDEVQGKKRGTNTIRIFEAGGYRIAHMGDIGCRPSPEQMKALQGLSVMLVPVGGFYTMEPGDVKALVKELAPTTVVPMHYRSDRFGYDVIATLDAYTSLCDDVVSYPRSTLVLPDDLKPQTAVLMAP